MTGQALHVTLESAADITPDVLTSLLRRHDPEATVTDVTIGHTWQGTTSHLHLDVKYADPHTRLPQRLFIKTQLGTVHDLPEAFDESLSEGDTRFHRDLRPDLSVETMTTFFADPLDGPSQFLILGEDITLRGAQVPDAISGLTVEQADALLATLGQLHAPFWGSQRLAIGGDLSWLQDPVDGGFAHFLRDNGFAIIRALVDAPYKTALLDAA